MMENTIAWTCGDSGDCGECKPPGKCPHVVYAVITPKGVKIFTYRDWVKVYLKSAKSPEYQRLLADEMVRKRV